MKKVIPNLKMGDKILARIEEVVSHSVFIVDFQGDLIRVNNLTRKAFSLGQQVRLQVTDLAPLSFKLDTGSFPKKNTFHREV